MRYLIRKHETQSGIKIENVIANHMQRHKLWGLEV